MSTDIRSTKAMPLNIKKKVMEKIRFKAFFLSNLDAKPARKT